MRPDDLFDLIDRAEHIETMVTATSLSSGRGASVLAMSSSPSTRRDELQRDPAPLRELLQGTMFAWCSMTERMSFVAGPEVSP